jgi:NhaA family Na+:H+ antiporter
VDWSATEPPDAAASASWTDVRIRDVALNVATALTTLLAIGAVSARIWPTRSDARPTPHRQVVVPQWAAFAQSTERIGPPPGSVPVTIVEFADFQCPFCRKAAGVLDSVLSDHRGQISLVWRNTPLDQHHYAMGAARAALCATRQGAFPAFHDQLFAHADSLGRIPWTRFASAAGVHSLDAFAACLRDTLAFPELARDTADAMRLGVVGTPTFLINDLLVVGNVGRDSIERLVRLATSRTSAAH